MQQSNLKISRRHFLQTTAAAAAAAALPFKANAETALKPIWLNQYTYTAPDMKKTVDWYIEVFGMQKGFSNAKETHLWFGDLQGDTRMIVKQAQAGDVAPGLTKFGFTVNYWDKNHVQAELKKRNINAQSDTDKGFWFKDPEGNEIGVFAHDYMKRPSAPPIKPTVWKALSGNHIVVLTSDYKKLTAWYNDLLAFNQTTDSGRDVCLWFGDTVWLPTNIREGGKTSAQLGTLDHCALTVADYDTPKVVAELKRLKIIPADSKIGADGQPDYGIYGVDLNNFKTQVCSWMEAPTQDDRRLERSLQPPTQQQRGQRRP
jgi:catechol 2,3-dioxygenase-like lactoylglutathione lyase family enzyme